MAYTLVNANTAISTTGALAGITPTCVSTTAGNLLVMAVMLDHSSWIWGTPASWQVAVSITGGANMPVVIFYYPNCPAGITSVACTLSNGPATAAATEWFGQILEFHDAAGSSLTPLDQTGQVAQTSSTSSPLSDATSGAVTAAHELAVGCGCGFYSSATKDSVSAGSGFTQSGQRNNAIKDTTHMWMDYQLDTGTSLAVVTDAVTFTGPFSQAYAPIATFKIFTPGGLLPQQIRMRRPALPNRLTRQRAGATYGR